MDLTIRKPLQNEKYTETNSNSNGSDLKIELKAIRILLKKFNADSQFS